MAEASTSRLEGAATLGGRLRSARRSQTFLSQSRCPPSAILHPLYAADDEDTRTRREQFRQEVGAIRASLLRLRSDVAAPIRRPADQEEGTSTAESTRDKKQRILSLMKESSSHSITVEEGVDLLDVSSGSPRRPYLPAALNAFALSSPRQGSWPTESLEEAKEAMRCFIKVCEDLAKELNMEAFSEEHNATDDGGADHTHTLTLAAAILVLDLEAGLVKEAGGRWRPQIRIRISYATDSAAVAAASTTLRKRDPSLGDCIRRDLQGALDLLLGWADQEPLDKMPCDAFAEVQHHMSRIYGNLRCLKRFDDLSPALKGEMTQCPDLFAALEDISAKLKAESGQKIDVGLGIYLAHTTWPYANLFFYTTPSDTAREASASSEALQQFVEKDTGAADVFRSIHIGVKRYPSVWDHITLALPAIGMDDIHSDGMLLYTAILDRPVAMPASTAHLLVKASGIISSPGSEQNGHAEDKPRSEGRGGFAPQAWQDILLTQSRIDPAPDAQGVQTAAIDLHFASPVAQVSKASDDGVLVSWFPFASIEHLRAAIKILRHQCHLNDLLREVNESRDLSAAEADEDELEALISGYPRHKESRATATVSVRHGMDGSSTISIFVPLSVDTWILEVHLLIAEKNIELKSTLSQLGKRSDRVIEPDETTRQECLSDLLEKGGRSMKSAILRLRRWALATVHLQLDAKG